MPKRSPWSLRLGSIRLREPFNGLSHLAAAVAALPGLILLLYLGRHQALQEVALLVYGSTLVLMFSSSAAYHLIEAGPSTASALRKFDHAAIYLLIAGTYTPICLRFFTGFWQWGLLGIIWALASAGVVAKLFWIRAPRGLTAGAYLAMGWLGIAAARQIFLFLPTGAILWLLAGGLFFTVGTVVYITRWPDLRPGTFGFHGAWHLFVILGCLCHFILIAAFVAPAALPG